MPLSERDPYEPLISLFPTVEAYNQAAMRHPLPDLADVSITWWRGHYTGFEQATAIPKKLDSGIANDYLGSLAKFSDWIDTQERQPTSAWNCIARATQEASIPKEVRDATFSMIVYKNAGNLGPLRGYLSEFIVKVMHANGVHPAKSEKQLAVMGIKVRPHRMKRGVLEFVSYDPHENVTAAQLIRTFADIQNASPLGFWLSHCDRIKPQYTQPMMLYFGESIERSRELLPHCQEHFSVLAGQYRDTGLEGAVQKMRALVIKEQKLT